LDYAGRCMVSTLQRDSAGSERRSPNRHVSNRSNPALCKKISHLDLPWFGLMHQAPGLMNQARGLMKAWLTLIWHDFPGWKRWHPAGVSQDFQWGDAGRMPALPANYWCKFVQFVSSSQEIFLCGFKWFYMGLGGFKWF